MLQPMGPRSETRRGNYAFLIGQRIYRLAIKEKLEKSRIANCQRNIAHSLAEGRRSQASIPKTERQS